MTTRASPDVATLLRAASRNSIMPAAERRSGPTLDRSFVETLIPHRDPLLLVDRITHVDHAESVIACAFDLGRAAWIFEGHFPGRPLWPGVLQIEAIGQAGLCMLRLLNGRRDDPDHRGFALTQVLGAEFVRPVTPGGEVEIVARVLSDGLFDIVVGQCLQHDVVCSAAALRGITEEHRNDP